MSASRNVASWIAALDQLDADLTATAEALANGGREPHRSVPALSSVVFPSGPMPPELGPRAEDLLHRTRELEAGAAAQVEEIREALRALAGHRPQPSTPTGRIVDVGA